jgi:Tfp pilus assembly protein FimT
MVELLIVLALAAIAGSLAGPSMRGLRGGQAVRGARGEVVATIEAARAAALQRGRLAWVVRSGNVLRAVVDTGGPTGRVVVATADLRQLYRAELSTAAAADDSVTFDGRGLANPRLGRTARYVIRAIGTAQADSVCISNLGLLLPPGCLP